LTQTLDTRRSCVRIFSHLHTFAQAKRAEPRPMWELQGSTDRVG
jgi:hypothetical protein